MDSAAGNKPKRLKNAILCGSLAAVLAVPTMLAYLTDTDSKTNKFSFAESLTVEVLEPSWNETDANQNGIPDAAEGMVPTQSIAKDPSVKVTGADAYVFVEVKVPTATVVLNGSAGQGETEIFDIDFDTKNWTETATGQPSGGYVKHVYRYNKVLEKGATTEPLFTKATVKNIKSNNGKVWTANHTDIQVNAHAIQAEGFDNANEAWSAYKEQNDL